MAVVAAVGLVLNELGLAHAGGLIQSALVVLAIALSIGVRVASRQARQPPTGRNAHTP